MNKHFLNYFFISWLALVLPLAGTMAQSGVVKGEKVKDLPIKKFLNQNSTAKTLSDLDSKILLVDFFATWCVPCLKAIPHLTRLKQSFAGELEILLVSNEDEEHLKQFLEKRKNISLPVMVDEDNSWNNFFQPPALPYSVVVKNGRVLAVTTAEEITEAVVNAWLQEAVFVTENEVVKQSPPENIMPSNSKSNVPVIAASQELLYAIKTANPTNDAEQRLAKISFDDLQTSLNTDEKKKAFWLNLYNSFTQLLLKNSPELYNSRDKFFKSKLIEVAGLRLSLDDIEHGILRRSKIKWSWGYLNKPFPPSWEKALRVNDVDYRIHFALNCGAKSCPPIAFYNDANIDRQLDLATKGYLTSEVEYDAKENVVHVPKLMSWFRGDFGGKKGAMKIIKSLGLVPEDASPKMKFKPYNWNLSLNQYSN